MRYCRMTFKTANGRKRSVWAKRINPPNPNDPELERYDFLWFRRVKKDGGSAEPIELIGLTESDIISIRKAEMNLHYAELEIVQEDEGETQP